MAQTLHQINLSKAKSITSLTFGFMASGSLDISKNKNLTTLVFDNKNYSELKCRAINSDVATAIAGVITSTTAADGTVYVPSTDPYFSTIQTAATTKGWSVEELPTE